MFSGEEVALVTGVGGCTSHTRKSGPVRRLIVTDCPTWNGEEKHNSEMSAFPMKVNY